MVDCIIKFLRDSGDILPPRVAYAGTSAAFDIAASETTMIPAHSFVEVPTGIRLSIDQNDKYYMMIHMRSSYGFKLNLQCHQGIVDAGYTGPFGVKVFNNTDKNVLIEKGQYFAQVVVHEKPSFEFEELSPTEWAEFSKKQLRGSQGFGSSN